MQFKRDFSQNSNKIALDKYFTDDKLAKKCIEKTFEIIGKENISEIIEPSAGCGSFSKNIKNSIAYDIEPEDSTILKQDFLNLVLEYKKGRLFIGNPPYGARNNLAKKFANKCFEYGDFVAFILPISQLNNTQSIYKFDLIYSENLGEQDYSGRKIRTCFNIYKRPSSGKFNNLRKFGNSEILEILEIRESIKNKNPKRNKLVKNFNYDIAICAWGASIGKKIKKEGEFVKEFYIKIKDEKRKQKILYLLENADWGKIYPMTSTPNLLQWQVYSYIEKNI